jgi:oxalate decarboxylase/phosphoglucose isomerase-like protein (cupin superfamily)
MKMRKFVGVSLLPLIALAGQDFAKRDQTPAQAQSQQRSTYQGKPMPPNMPGTYTVIRGADLQAVLAQTTGDTALRVTDAPSGHIGVFILTYQPLAPQPGAPARALYRTETTEIYYVLEGTGSMILGGELENATETDPQSQFVKTTTGPTASGTAKDYTVVRFSPGTVVIVPPGVPHYAPHDIISKTTFLLLRIDPKKTINLK